ncbi:MAG: sugar phosphate nucleotidyltransferase [Anaerolineales bacterium]
MQPTRLDDVHVTILAGGSGTRLWPLSRHSQPKQLLPLLGETSLLRQTIERVLPLVPWERIYVLSGPDHAEAIARELPELGPENLFIEPSPRGTAPCLGLAALRLCQRAGEGIMISLHADHVVRNAEAFRAALCASIETAREGYLVTVGIVPDQPETGFGYIQRGELLAQRHGLNVYRLARFVEKPPLDLAQAYVASGEYCWNAGYFTWRLDAILAAFAEFLPEQYAALQTVAGDLAGPTGLAAWQGITPVTIDVGIMERAREAAVVPCDMGWSDVGGFGALYALLPHDEAGNATGGEGRYVPLDGGRNLVLSPRLVATIGLEDLVVIDTEDALLVLPRERAQDVSALVRRLHELGLDRHL